MRLTMGEMLHRFRIEKGITIKELSEGLCTISQMANYESGERIPDILVFECMMERMGISPEEFALMVTEKEFLYYEWKMQVYDAIEWSDWKKLGQLLEANSQKTVVCNQKLEKQFLTYITAIYKASEKDFMNATILLEVAARQTMSDMYHVLKKDILLGTLEIHILMLYMYYGIKGKRLTIENGLKLFHGLEDYIYCGKLELNEQAMCYPKLICIGLHCFKTEITNEKQLELCSKAICLLRKNKTFHDITELLRLYQQLLEKNDRVELGFYKKQYEVFYDLLENENLDTGFRVEILGVRKPKVYMINEYLLSKRAEYGLTQEKLSEGICEPETYSRIETGKRAPLKRNLQRLAERLDINWCYFRGALDTCDREAFRLRRKQRQADIEGHREESLELLLELEKILDMDNVINYQYVKSREYLTRYRLGHLELEETYKKLEELLSLTQKEGVFEYKFKYYTQTELEIIGDMALLLKKSNKNEEGIILIEKIIKQISHTKMSLEYHWNAYSFLLNILSGLYCEIGKYDIGEKIARYVKQGFLRRRDASNLPVILDEIADNLEHMGEQYSDEYKRLYRYTYYLGDFFWIEKATKFAKKYYEEKFDKDFIWYYP